MSLLDSLHGGGAQIEPGVVFSITRVKSIKRSRISFLIMKGRQNEDVLSICSEFFFLAFKTLKVVSISCSNDKFTYQYDSTGDHSDVYNKMD